MIREPKTRRGQASRRRIVDAAVDLMFLHGVRATGLDEILAAANVGKGQFYHYFADKDALVRAVVARQAERILENHRLILEHLTSWEAIATWFAGIVHVQEQGGCVGGCPLGSLASELADQDETVRTDLVATFDRWEGYLARGLERMRAQGALRSDADPAVLASATMASLQGGLLLAQTRKDVRALQRALDGAFVYLQTFAVQGPAVTQRPGT